MNFKRRKTKRNVVCTLCTPHRWRGNHKGRFKGREELDRQRIRRDRRLGLYDDL